MLSIRIFPYLNVKITFMQRYTLDHSFNSMSKVFDYML